MIRQAKRPAPREHRASPDVWTAKLGLLLGLRAGGVEMSGRDPCFDEDHPAVVDDGVDDAAEPAAGRRVTAAGPFGEQAGAAAGGWAQPGDPAVLWCSGSTLRYGQAGSDAAELSGAAGSADWPVVRDWGVRSARVRPVRPGVMPPAATRSACQADPNIRSVCRLPLRVMSMLVPAQPLQVVHTSLSPRVDLARLTLALAGPPGVAAARWCRRRY